MLLELQYIVVKKDEELAKKDAQIHELLQAYNAKLAKEYSKKIGEDAGGRRSIQ